MADEREQKKVVVELTEADAQDILAGAVPQTAIEAIRRALAKYQEREKK